MAYKIDKDIKMYGVNPGVKITITSYDNGFIMESGGTPTKLYTSIDELLTDMLDDLGLVNPFEEELLPLKYRRIKDKKKEDIPYKHGLDIK